MIKYLLLALVGWASSALIVWRLHEASTQGVMRLRGGTYTRSGNPIWFWVNVVAAIIGLVLCVGIALIGSSMMLRIIV